MGWVGLDYMLMLIGIIYIQQVLHILNAGCCDSIRCRWILHSNCELLSSCWTLEWVVRDETQTLVHLVSMRGSARWGAARGPRWHLTSCSRSSSSSRNTSDDYSRLCWP